MSHKPISEMNHDQFQDLIETYIDESSAKSGDMATTAFFDLVFENLANRVQDTIEVTGRIVNEQLEFSMPGQESVSIQVQGNQIVIGNQRIVIKLESA